jgi:hypothetical protein
MKAVYLWPEEQVAPAEHVVAISIEVHHMAERPDLSPNATPIAHHPTMPHVHVHTL